MTPKQLNYKKELIKIIHVCRKRSMLEEENYRTLLYEQFGASSSTELGIDELKELALMLGYNKLSRTMSPREDAVVYEFAGLAKRGGCTSKQVETILGLWQENARNKERAALLAFALKTLKKTPLRLGLLSRREASKLIIAIKALGGEK